MLSSHVKIIDIGNGVHAVFNNMVFKPVFMNEEEVRALYKEEFDKDTLFKLQERGIIVSDSTVDGVAFDRLHRFVSGKKGKVRILYLIVSSLCNLDCRYCFIERNPYSTSEYGIMSPQIAIKAVNLLMSDFDYDSGDVPEILFYGGEPLLARETIKETIGFIRREYGDYPKITIISNATLIDRSLAKFFKDYSVGLGISIDGPKDINDSGRVFRNSVDSVYDAVCESINILKEERCSFGLSITVTPEVIKRKREIIDWVKEMGIQNIFWNLYHFPAPDDSWLNFYEDLSCFVFDSYDELLKYGIRDGRVDELLKLYADDCFRYESCGAIGLNQVAVSPNGDVFICHGDNRNPKMKCGNIQNIKTYKEVFNSRNAQNYCGVMTVDRKECRECEALFVCGGGCPSHSESLFEDRYQLDHTACVFYKKYLHWILKKSYNMNV